MTNTDKYARRAKTLHIMPLWHFSGNLIMSVAAKYPTGRDPVDLARTR